MLTDEQILKIRKQYNIIPTVKPIQPQATLGGQAVQKQPTGVRDDIGIPKPIQSVSDVGIGAIKGVGSTLKGSSSLGERMLRGGLRTLLPKKAEEALGIQKTAPTGAEKVIPDWLSKPEGTAEKIGFGAEQVGEFFIPGTSSLKAGKAVKAGIQASKFARFAKPSGLLTRAVLESGIVGGQRALQKGEIDNDVKTTALIAGAFPIVGAGIKVGTRKLVPKLISLATDVQPRAFDVLLERSKQVNRAIRNKVTPDINLAKTQKATRNLRTKLTKEWQDGMKFIKTKYKGQNFSFPVRVKNLMKKVQNDFPGSFELPRNMFNVQSNKALSIYSDLNELLSRRAVRESAQGINVRKLRDEYRKFIVEKFGGKGGDVDTLLKNYSAKMDIFNGADDIVKAFQTNKPISQATARGRLDAIFNEGKTAYLDAMLQLEKEMGIDIISNVAGAKFLPIFPSSRAGITAGGQLSTKKGITDRLIEMLVLPLSSPRGAKNIFEATQKKEVGGLFGRFMSELPDVKKPNLTTVADGVNINLSKSKTKSY